MSRIIPLILSLKIWNEILSESLSVPDSARLLKHKIEALDRFDKPNTYCPSSTLKWVGPCGQTQSLLSHWLYCIKRSANASFSSHAASLKKCTQ